MTKKTTTFSLTTNFKSYTEFINYLKSIYIQFIKSIQKISYGNVACTIDLETSSFYNEEKEKTAIMYAGTIGINGSQYLFRTYDELIQILTDIRNIFELNESKRLIFYIHNCGFDFQFINRHFDVGKVFAINKREPVKALLFGDSIEVRDSLVLSGYSLEKTGEHLQKYKVNKLVGDLDYDLIRHSKTPLTDKEKGYIFNDGLVVMAYIQEQIENHANNITRIPLTKTGEIRNLTRKNCLYGGVSSHKKNTSTYRDYHRFMLGLSIRSVEEYLQLRTRVFVGGFTHANAFYNGVVVKDVDSFDFTSSYPYVMISEKYPYGRAELIEITSKEQLENSLDKYCCMFDVRFVNIEDKITYEHPISVSHCRKKINALEDNGRLVKADMIETSLTDVDFQIIKRFYKWERMYIKNFRRYKKQYLPKAFIQTILDLYKKKTELKDVAGKEAEYLHGKELLNSLYGMTVTDICRPEISYEFDSDTNSYKWNVTELAEEDYEKMLKSYNVKRNRFLAYQWGVWVTAYARRNLFTGIYNAGMNYIYSDTDSIKLKLTPEFKQYVEEYNKSVLVKLKRAMDYHKLDIALCSPKTINGKVKTIGVWDYEAHYTRFKTLGAKRYMTEKDGKISLTVSGINKKYAIPYLQTLNKDLFDLFAEDLYIPKEYIIEKDGKEIKLSGTGKNIHTYIDTPQDGVVTDYLGNKSEYHELSSVHIEKADYTLSISDVYLSYLLSIQRKEYN